MTMLTFGLPGTGKSTYVLQFRCRVTLDLGGDVLTGKQYDKLRAFTSEALKSSDMVWDTYPQYFEPSKIPARVKVLFAIPQSEMEIHFVLERVRRRDAVRNANFIKFYAKKIVSWRNDWLRIVEEWNNYCDIAVCSYYDNNKMVNEQFVPRGKWEGGKPYGYCEL